MAVPVDPTVSSIVTQALKRAGRTTPTATQITEATDHALQEVKADIMLVAATHPHLQVTSTLVTTRGQQRYAIPMDANDHISISLLDGPDEWRGTAQSGGTSSITFAAGFSGDPNGVEGKYVIITSGTGIEEYRQIIDYDDSTKVATVALPWTSSPNSSSTYLIVSAYYPLYPLDVPMELDKITTQTSLGIPKYVSIFSQEFFLYPVPDKSTYGLLNRYWSDLSKLDESNTLFIQLLREWRSLWIQGIAVKSMQRFDEDRYGSELGVYNFMLQNLASQTTRVTPVRFFDV